ncbi:MAG: DJ-1/PfpI family protein [Clostridiales bacterium]|nr:DJ-1/PfpI family protein [Clostridiales bacterium]MDD7432607.1 DJ-1/PfpI family protein [Clostridiales bacterium]MDY3061834.1 DJ-1 family glyoxalase III [Eubacteriales bacterium]
MKKNGLKKTALVFAADGCEEIETLTQVDFLRRAGVEVTLCSVNRSREIHGAHGIVILGDALLSECKDKTYDALITPGGLPGSETLRDHPTVIAMLQTQAERGGLICSICASPIVLEAAGLTRGRVGTSYPGFEEGLSYKEYREEIVWRDGNLITARGPATSVYFALEIVRALLGEEAAEKLRVDILQNLVEEQICNAHQ